jgi:group I intron endonuclease
MIGIYKIENVTNGKVYIGQSRNIEKRWKRHANSAFCITDKSYELPLYRSIRKERLENFNFEILEEYSINELDLKEKEWILFYNSLSPNGYNLKFGNNGPSKLIPKEVLEIQDLLISTQYTNKEIGLFYDICDDSVGLINNGKTWLNESLIYPLRQSKFKAKTSKSFCPICKKEKARSSEICLSCFSKKQKEGRPSKEVLDKELRELNFVKVGKKYGVSDNTIRRWCKSYGMSTSSRDYK